MRVSNTAIGLSLIIFACAVLVHVRSFPKLDNGYPGPALFPSVLAVLFIFCGIGLIIQGIRNREKLLKIDLGTVTLAGWINIAFVLGTVACYIFFAEYVGFLIFSFVILMILMKWLKVKMLHSLVMSITVTLAIYLLFAKVLLVPLPWGLWGW
ncbi:MAG: tripartite tricarboxylate transporter TctB family protein [bacterium]|nr:tripartite tricarboxylate transporter TctB family protein [bacterium]